VLCGCLQVDNLDKLCSFMVSQLNSVPRARMDWRGFPGELRKPQHPISIGLYIPRADLPPSFRTAVYPKNRPQRRRLPLTTTANLLTTRLAADLDRGRSLPASWYIAPSIVKQERESIFRHPWQYIGRAEQLARPGDFITGSAGEIPIVVVHGDGGLKRFVNVCHHRRHEVMSGAGTKKLWAMTARSPLPRRGRRP
jgi:hypothetical protein